MAKIPVFLVFLMSCALVLPGCKGNKDPAQNPRVPVSASPQNAIPSPSRATPQQEYDEAMRVLGPADDDETPDAGVARTEPSGPSVEEQKAEEERRQKARAATEKAVNDALGTVLPRLRGCLAKAEGSSGAASVKLRVHRQGYVLDSTVDGVDYEARSCIRGVLGSLRVSGVQTDTVTVERRFDFRKK